MHQEQTAHLTLGTTPYEKLTGKQPKRLHVRVFGCPACLYNKYPSSKIKTKAIPGIHVGLNDHDVYILQTLTA